MIQDRIKPNKQTTVRSVSYRGLNHNHVAYFSLIIKIIKTVILIKQAPFHL